MKGHSTTFTEVMQDLNTEAAQLVELDSGSGLTPTQAASKKRLEQTMKDLDAFLAANPRKKTSRLVIATRALIVFTSLLTIAAYLLMVKP